MKTIIKAITVLSLIGIIFSSCSQGVTSDYNKGLTESNKEGKIHWVSIEDVEALNKEVPKKVLVDAYTSWCGWCKRMDAQTFAHPDVVKYVNDNFYAVKYDAETKDTLSFKGKDYTFVQGGRRGYNQLTTYLLKGRRSYPTISFLDENTDLIDAFPGFKKADQFDALMQFIAGDHFKAENFTAYNSKFVSTIKPTEAAAKTTIKRSPTFKTQPAKTNTTTTTNSQKKIDFKTAP